MMAPQVEEIQKSEVPQAESPALDPSCGCPLKAEAPETPQPPSGFAKRWGEWAHGHRETFDSPAGRLVFRNVAKTLVGVVPTVLAFNMVSHGFNAYNKSNFNGGIHKFLKGFTKVKLLEQGAYVFAGYTAFRSFCKVFQRNYDRIFAKADDASKATQAIDHLPSNIVKDFREIIGPEMISTAIAAFPLAAIRTGFRNGEPPLSGNMKQAIKGYPRDWLGSVVAYYAFFEPNDRIYNDITGGKDSGDYYKQLAGRPPVKHDDAAHKKYAFFTEDGPGRLIFRRGGELLIGMASHIGLQRMAWAKFGQADPQKFGFLKNLAKEYGAYAGFSTYTGIAEIYNNAYDKLFDRLEAKEREKAGSR